jgi:hypothetical protein
VTQDVLSRQEWPLLPQLDLVTDTLQSDGWLSTRNSDTAEANYLNLFTIRAGSNLRESSLIIIFSLHLVKSVSCEHSKV